MSNNNKITTGQLIWADIVKYTRRFELFFEKNTAWHVIVKTAIFIFGLLAAIDDAVGIFDRFWSPEISRIILISLLLAVLIIDFGHVLIAKRRAFELHRKDSLILNMTNIIREASELNSPPYNIIDWYSEHDITIDGDVNFKKNMRIEYIKEPVYWVKVPIGVVNGETEDKFEDLNIEITNPDDGGKLPYAVIEETDRRKTLAVMLEPPVKLDQPSAIRIRLRWRGAYAPLIREFQDHGRIAVQHDTAKLVIRFIAPHGIEFTGIRMIHHTGDFKIEQQPDGRSILTWSCTNVKKGDYTYTLVAKKSEP